MLNIYSNQAHVTRHLQSIDLPQVGKAVVVGLHLVAVDKHIVMMGIACDDQLKEMWHE